MKKWLVIGSLSAVLVLSGTITTMASESNKNVLQVVNTNISPTEFSSTNYVIASNWNSLTQEQRNYYVNNRNSAPVEYFPFGIDTTVSKPKGFPDCKPGQNPADYKPTRPELPPCDR